MDWRIKLGMQFVLARTPGGTQVNHVLQHLNGSHSARRARSRFRDLAANFAHIRAAGLDLEGMRAVEIGTGWNAINTLLFYALGAGEVHTYDLRRHIRSKLVRRAVVELHGAADLVAEVSGVEKEAVRGRLARLLELQTAEDIFAAAGIHYHAPADAAQTGLPDASVDLVYSYWVYEHITPETVGQLNREARRILRPHGLAYHGIGLHDHFTGVDRNITAVNFLQYSDRWWDVFVQHDLGYHNRLRERDFLGMFERDGFDVAFREPVVDARSLAALEVLPVHPKFHGYTKEELAVVHTLLALRPKVAAGVEPADARPVPGREGLVLV